MFTVGRPTLETANVIFTDTVDSTSTLRASAPRPRRRCAAVTTSSSRTSSSVFGGRVVKSTGDGALALLPSADHLVRAGSAVQEAATAEGMPLRVGMSTGDVMSEHGDCFGEPVVVASRLCAPVRARRGPGRCRHGRGAGASRGPAGRPSRRTVAEGVRRTAGGVDGLAVGGAGSRAVEPVEPLYGRDDELAADRAGVEVGRGTVAGACICGEPGIGKTHLARTVAGRGGDPVVVRFDATARDGFAVWCAALDASIGEIPVGVIAALGPEVVSRIAGLLPSITAHLPVDALEGPDTPAGRTCSTL